MRINKTALVAWGSLICNPDELSFDGRWREDGPQLPVEFARVSKDGRLTLVLHPGASLVPTLWSLSTSTQLEETIESLRARERTTTENIGFVSFSKGTKRCQAVPAVAGVISKWTHDKGLDGAIWTDLPSNFLAKTGMNLTEDNAVVYLRTLQGVRLAAARHYIVSAPRQVRTDFRRHLEVELSHTTP